MNLKTYRLMVVNAQERRSREELPRVFVEMPFRDGNRCARSVTVESSHTDDAREAQLRRPPGRGRPPSRTQRERFQ
jgi:hypothetical protein